MHYMYYFPSGNGKAALLHTTGNVTHTAEFHTAHHLKLYTKFPTSKCRMWTTMTQRQWHSGSSATKPNYKVHVEFTWWLVKHRHRCGKIWLMIFSVYVIFNKYNTFYQAMTPNMYDLVKSATKVANSAWHAVYGWGSIHPDYQHKEFALFGTGKSTTANTRPFSIAIFS